jgi:hypothetical protein
MQAYKQGNEIGPLLDPVCYVKAQTAINILCSAGSLDSDSTDAFDMRKPLSGDKDRDTVRAGGEDFRVDPSSVSICTNFVVSWLRPGYLIASWA